MGCVKVFDLAHVRPSAGVHPCRPAMLPSYSTYSRLMAVAGSAACVRTPAPGKDQFRFGWPPMPRPQCNAHPVEVYVSVNVGGTL